MGANSKIEWTHHTWNPWWGCVKVSAECDNCYAEVFSARTGYGENPVSADKFPIWGKDTKRRFFGDKHWNMLDKLNIEAAKLGERQRVFVASMADIMEDHPDVNPHRLKLYGKVDRNLWLDHLFLTKRPQNFRRFLPVTWLMQPRPNVWGMTTCAVKSSKWRIDALRDTPFAVRGLSIEPLIEDVGTLNLDGIHWVIVGGESGPGARPMQAEWARSIRDQCVAAGVAFHFKQWGDWKEGKRIGKHSAGRILDGRTWDELPQPVDDPGDMAWQ